MTAVPFSSLGLTSVPPRDVAKWTGPAPGFAAMLCLLAVVLDSAVGASVDVRTDDDLTYNPTFDPSEPQPQFTTVGRSFKVVTKDTIVLPCEVTDLGSYKLVWKRGIAVLTAGSVKVTPDDRVSLVDRFNLQIQNVKTTDGGDYICQLGTMTPKEITHTVEILVPPRFLTGPGGVPAELTVKSKDTVHLECRAGGNPVPNITWSRVNNQLPPDAKVTDSSALEIPSVTREHIGLYQCTASNGVGQSASHNISLRVLYEPAITVERKAVHAGVNVEAELVCIVHAEPPAEVKWYRDTLQLDVTERRIMEVRGSKHTLFINNITNDDFGNYSCMAENSLGRQKKTIELSGKPQAPVLDANRTVSEYHDAYNISWTVESVEPPMEYQLSFRRYQAPGGVSTEVLNSKLQESYKHHRRDHHRREHHNQHHQQGYGHHSRRENNEVYDPGNGVTLSDWRQVLIEVKGGLQPAVRRNYETNTIRSSPSGINRFLRRGSFVLRDLESGATYEAIVSARNSFGWGRHSNRLYFSTRGDDPEVRSVGVAYSSSASELKTKLTLFIIISIFLLVCQMS